MNALGVGVAILAIVILPGAIIAALFLHGPEVFS